MMNSTFNPTCADNGSLNEYVYVCMYVRMYNSFAEFMSYMHVNIQLQLGQHTFLQQKRSVC